MIALLKRRLRPFRPVLLPIWRRLEPLLIDRHRPGPARRPSAEGPAPGPVVLRATDRPQPPIRALSRDELVRLGATIPYYRERLAYMGAAGAVATVMIKRKGLLTALELGPYLRPLIVGADVMDARLAAEIQAEGRRIAHNATKVPWPFAEREYDLFVALQVFEHLGARQAEAFREVRRVARNAILSLPIDWKMDDPADCHHRLSEQRVLAWFAPVLPTRVVVGNRGYRKRLIFVFEDLPPPDDEAGIASPEPHP